MGCLAWNHVFLYKYLTLLAYLLHVQNTTLHLGIDCWDCRLPLASTHHGRLGHLMVMADDMMQITGNMKFRSRIPGNEKKHVQEWIP
jgi:hypothetical protein